MSVDTAEAGNPPTEASESKESGQVEAIGEETINERALEGNEDKDSPDGAISGFSLDEEKGAESMNPSGISDDEEKSTSDQEDDENGDEGDEDSDAESVEDDGEEKGELDDLEHFDHLVEKELESVGLGKKADKWRPDFSLDKMIAGNMNGKKVMKEDSESSDINIGDDSYFLLDKRETGKKTEGFKDKRETKHRARTTQSEKYKKLVNAVKKMRQKREGDELIGKMYGGDDERSTDNEKSRSIRSKNREMQEELDEAQFEEPVVFSVE